MTRSALWRISSPEWEEGDAGKQRVGHGRRIPPQGDATQLDRQQPAGVVLGEAGKGGRDGRAETGRRAPAGDESPDQPGAPRIARDRRIGCEDLDVEQPSLRDEQAIERIVV